MEINLKCNIRRVSLSIIGYYIHIYIYLDIYIYLNGTRSLSSLTCVKNVFFFCINEICRRTTSNTTTTTISTITIVLPLNIWFWTCPFRLAAPVILLKKIKNIYIEEDVLGDEEGGSQHWQTKEQIKATFYVCVCS